MTLENRIRSLAAEKLKIRVTRRRRGPFVVVRPDGLQTIHKSKREALQRLFAELRCTNSIEWEICVLLKSEATNDR